MLTQLVIMSAVTYRLVRFIVIDSIFDGPRNRVHGWLLGRRKPWSLKLHEGLSCNACMSVWCSAFVIWMATLFDVSVRLPVAQWLACSTGALVFAIIIDPVEDDEEN